MIQTKEQFVERYVARSGSVSSVDEFNDTYVVLPCDCEDGGGPTHWAALRRIPEIVEDHLEFSAPKGTPWPEEVPIYNG